MAERKLINDASAWEKIVEEYAKQGKKIALAESCTGGLIAKELTDVPGASDVFELGLVSYSVDAKVSVLGINKSTIEEKGVVSPNTASEMAERARALAHADVGIGVTGYAGPSGGDEKYPNGTVFLALSDGGAVYVRRITAQNGTRSEVRAAAAQVAADMLTQYINGSRDRVGAVVPTPVFSGPENVVARGAKAKKKLPWYKRFLKFFTDFPKDSIAGKIKKIVIVCLVGVMCFAGYKLFSGMYYYAANDIIERELDDIINNTSSLTPEERQGIIDDLASRGVEVPEDTPDWMVRLLQINPDVVGVVTISTQDDPGYMREVVVQSYDNDYYLRRDIRGNYNTLGCVFMDYRDRPDATSNNTILYGHATRQANKKFNKLHQYKKLSFLNENPIIEYSTLTDTYYYKIFAVMILNMNPDDGEIYTGCYNVGSGIYGQLDNIRARSMFNTQVDVKEGDRLLTLSTCTFELSDLRLVVMARQVREGESLEVKKASNNRNCIYFDGWYRATDTNPPVFSDISDIDESGSTDDLSDISDVNSSVSSNEPAVEDRFEIFDLSLHVNKNSSVKVYVPYLTDYGLDCFVGMPTKPSHGTVKLVSSKMTVEYTPDRNYTGIDTFTLSLLDEGGLNYDTATVTVYVGVNRTTGISIGAEEVRFDVKARESGSVQVDATSVTGQRLTYHIVKNEGMFSGTATVSSSGLLTYTSTTGRQYRDRVKLIVTDEDGYGRVILYDINHDRSYQYNDNPYVSRPVDETSSGSVSSVVSSVTSTETSSVTSTETSADEPVESNGDDTPPESNGEEQSGEGEGVSDGQISSDGTQTELSQG